MRRVLALSIPVLLTGCIDYWIFGPPKDDNEGGRRPDRVPGNGNLDDDPVDTGDTGPVEDDTDVDTPDDTGEVEDPATCDGWAPPETYTVAVDATCANTTPLYPISPTLEWSWTAHPSLPGWDNVETNPMVAHLDDDDGDGLIGPGDTPDIVFMSQRNDNYWTGNGAITVVDGATGAEKWSHRTVSGERLNPASHPAIGDLDGDGVPEVCASGWDHAVVCMDGPTGALVWAAGSEPAAFGGVVISDMDADGFAEVVYGRQILDYQGNTLGVGTLGFGGIYFFSVPAPGSAVADWDGDGVQEVVAGNAVYEIDGSTTQDLGGDDTLVAVADLDLDGLPDVVRTGNQKVLATLNDGSTAWEIATPGGGLGGPATIVDLDQDGTPEVVVSDFTKLSALRAADGSVVWSVTIADTSSGALGTLAWDIDQDGFPELIHADQHAWRVYDGQTGSVLHEDTGHASSTGAEHPIVADVDGDGEGEILIASNDGFYAGWNGLRVYGSGGVGWPPARQIWNQYQHVVTNIEDDASLPAPAPDHWTDGWNEVRSAGQTDVRAHWRPDLQPGEPELCLDDCDHGVVHLSVPVENVGLVGAAGSTARIVDPAGAEVHALAVPALATGEAAWLETWTVDAETWGSGSLTLQVDADGVVDECDEADQQLDLGPWPCPS
jgi:outer membrane protein assembly factor BamB